MARFAASVPVNSTSIDKYVSSVKIMNARTGYEYSKRLEYFTRFLTKEYHLNIDDLIITLTRPSQGPRIDIYDLLSGYVSYLQKTSVKPNTIKLWISTVRGFLEYYDVEISPRKFRIKVKFPRVIRESKEALTNEDIIEILNACSFSLKLKTYVMFLASTGVRATEATSIRLCDYDVVKSKVSIRGEYTKTKTDRYVFLTSEMNRQLQVWINYKYRTRKIVTYSNLKKNQTVTKTKTPVRKEEELIFSSKIGEENTMSSVRGMYVTLVDAFDKALDRMGGKFATYEDIYKRRRKITLHSFRRHVKSTISDLGYGDYSEWFIGHSGSTYYRKSEKEKYELFLKIESYLTYLDFASLERKGADIASKIEALEKQNQKLTIESKKITEALDKIDSLKKRLGVS